MTGLVNKIKAYRLQEDGLDTVEANQALGFEDDLRSYELAAEMLRLLEIPSVCLLTNNPRKVEGLREHGVRVVGCIPMRIPASDHNRRYLRTKREKSGHTL